MPNSIAPCKKTIQLKIRYGVVCRQILNILMDQKGDGRNDYAILFVDQSLIVLYALLPRIHGFFIKFQVGNVSIARNRPPEGRRTIGGN